MAPIPPPFATAGTIIVGRGLAPAVWYQPTARLIPQSATLTAPNWRPSPLSLCDISPHCGESPFTREPKVLQPICLPCKGRWLRACEQTEGLSGGSKPPPYGNSIFCRVRCPHRTARNNCAPATHLIHTTKNRAAFLLPGILAIFSFRWPCSRLPLSGPVPCSGRRHIPWSASLPAQTQCP